MNNGQMKFTRSNCSEPELKEGEDAFFTGLFSTVTLIVNAIIWLILASVLIVVNAMVAAYVCGGVAALCILVWFWFHIVPRVWKWFISLVE